MKKEYFEFSGEKDTILPAIVWLPDEEVKGVVQIVHGMTEHMERYEKLAEVLTKVGIVVSGFDLRGHGKTDKDNICASLGEDGWTNTLKEIHTFHELMKQRFSTKNHYLLGFSLGSFLVREYFSNYDDNDFTGTIIMGTGQQPVFLLSVIMFLVKGEIKKVGFDNTTAFVRNLSFGMYNKKFQPNHTKADWLCSDKDELEKYIADELCKEDISAGLFWQLLGSMKRMSNRNAYTKWDKNTRILLLSGKDDPVGNAGKGVKLVYDAMKRNGLENVDFQLFQGGRHDILHEEKSGISEKVYEKIQNWID